MKTKLLLNLTTALTLVAGQGAFAAVGKVLVEPLKDIEGQHSAIERVIQQKANFETLKAKKGTEAYELAGAIDEVARMHELGSANDVQSFALRGTKEAKIVKSLARAEQVLETKDREGKLTDLEKAELSQIRTAIQASSGFVSALGKNPVFGVSGEKSNEALNKLISILPKMISEYTKDERQGYIKLLNEMTSELNRRDNTELPAEILKKKLGEERMNQLMGCKV
jgi:hypothetical protein